MLPTHVVSFRCRWALPMQPWQTANVIVPDREQGESEKNYWARVVDYLRPTLPLPALATIVILPLE